MITKISVSVERSHPARFSALLDELNKAKALADATERDVLPVINQAGERKYQAIIEQLFEIDEMRTQAGQALGEEIRPEARFVVFDESHTYGKECKIEWVYDGIKFICNGFGSTIINDYGNPVPLSKLTSRHGEYVTGVYGFVTMWNEYGIADKLLDYINKKLSRGILKANEKTARINQTLSNLLND